jgi:hypothetical protein
MYQYLKKLVGKTRNLFKNHLELNVALWYGG